MGIYNNLKDVFFDSKFHVGRGLAVYDVGLSSALFNTLPDLSAILANAAALNAIFESPISGKAFLESPVAVNRLLGDVMGLTSLINNQASITVLAGNKNIMDGIAANPTALNTIINNQSSLDIVINNTVALNALFSNVSAKVIMFGKDAVTSAIAANESAIAWLIANKAVTHTGYMGDNPPPTVITGGKALLLKWNTTAPASNRLFTFVTRAGTIGNVSAVQGVAPPAFTTNIMACNALTKKRTGINTTQENVIYIPME